MNPRSKPVFNWTKALLLSLFFLCLFTGCGNSDNWKPSSVTVSEESETFETQESAADSDDTPDTPYGTKISSISQEGIEFY